MSNFEKLIHCFDKLCLENNDSNLQELNFQLDTFNSLNYTQLSFNDEISVIIKKCCAVVTGERSLILAKCCQLLTNILTQNASVLKTQDLDCLIKWIELAIENSADIALIDIFQLIEAVTSEKALFENRNYEKLLTLLNQDLEKNVTALNSDFVRLKRIYCLRSLINVLPECNSIKYFLIFSNILQSQSTVDLLNHAKIWRIVLEGLSVLCSNQQWANLNAEGLIGDLIGIFYASVHLGLPGCEFKKPNCVYQSSFSELGPVENLEKSTGPLHNSKKRKTKLKKVAWTNHLKDENTSADDVVIENWRSKSEISTDCYKTSLSNWPTSDSDFSDNEMGNMAQTAKEQARVRHAACNLLIVLLKVYNAKLLSGYFCGLMGKHGLTVNLISETSNKTKVAVLGAISALFIKLKSFVAQAQYVREGSFRPLCSVVAEIVDVLHSKLCHLLVTSKGASHHIIVPLLHCSFIIISTTSYHRLPNGLLTKMFNAVYQYVDNKDPTITVGSIQCLTEIITVNPSTEEQKDLVCYGPDASTNSNENKLNFWSYTICLNNLNQNINEMVRISWWKFLAGLLQNHFDDNLIDEISILFKTVFLNDIKSNSKQIQTYSMKALEEFVRNLSQVEYEQKSLILWNTLLNSSFIELLQNDSPMPACDCVAYIGSLTFKNIGEKKQILLLTIVFGICCHSKPLARASGVRTLGMFLSYPDIIENEQFINDIFDTILKLLAINEQLIVRSKAAWAFANFTDLITTKQDNEFILSLDLFKLLEICVNSINDKENVKLHILRAIGNLMTVVESEHVKQVKYKEIIEKCTLATLKLSTTGWHMKMRWNACRTLGIILKNRSIQKIQPSWQVQVIMGLCQVLVKYNNFKVRAIAAEALSGIENRNDYETGIYIRIWESLLDGLDNSANMPDFREFEHQKHLKTELYTTILHLMSQLDVDDLKIIQSLLEFRLDDMRHYLNEFQSNVLPEKSSTTIVKVITHLKKLKNSRSDCKFLDQLLDLFVTKNN